MDYCKYGEVRRHGQYAAWEGYGYAPPYAPYTPYAHAYCPPHAHDPYARYYRYDYPAAAAAAAAAAHTHHNEHAMPMDYGAYVNKESRARRTQSRRDQRVHTAHHLPLPHTPPSECGGLNGRGGYCDAQMWPHYQMGMMGGVGAGGGGGAVWGGAHAGTWASRSLCSREQMRYFPNDARMIKGPYLNHSSQLCPPDGRSTPYPMYEDVSYGGDLGKHNGVVEYPARSAPQAEAPRNVRERAVSSPRRSPPEEKRPPVVPLPAFQQAFGSTEIGKFAEAFSRAEAVHEADDISSENFVYDAFQDWEGPAEPQWAAPPAAREIKCEDNY